MALTAGIVGVQGDVHEHVRAIELAGATLGVEVDARAVRRAGELPSCDVVALPGGESTTISRLIHEHGLADELRAHAAADKPLLATCAGLIVIATDPQDDRVQSLDLLDVTVERNAFGRQRESFETDLDIVGLDEPFPAVFIRAPAIDDPGATEVLATVDGRPVAVRDGSILATAFHPELAGDFRVHRLALFDGRDR
ncbi:MAG: pyridoxal 5'-phosphate synthase glutaminase subunit PdxT [Halobacteriota archaeon]